MVENTKKCPLYPTFP